MVSKKYYIMPAGIPGAIAYYVLNKKINIAGFLDNNKGRAETAEFCGLPITIPEKADKDSTVIIATYAHIKSISKQIQDLGFSDIAQAEDFICKESAYAVLEQMQKDNVENRYNLPSVEQVLKSNFINTENESDALTLWNIALTVTQRCTLKCRDCVSMMQYYQNPVDMDIEKTVESVDKLFECVDFVRNVSIIGGEPFLIKELALLIDKLCDYRQRIGKLSIITNGTLIPGDEILIAAKRADLTVVISDYGEFSKNKKGLLDKLQRFGVKHDIAKALTWVKHTEILEAQSDGNVTFENCETICMTMMNGKLYYCNFAVAGDALGVFPHNENNYVDLFSGTTTKEVVKSYCERSKGLPCCSYCSGFRATDGPIPRAIQTKEPLPYKMHT